MGCPIHIWLPLMGAAAPIARAARDRFRFARDARRAEAAPRRETRRWAPVGDSTTRPVETSKIAR